MKKINSNKVFDAVNIAILVLITFTMLYPLYFVIIASFSDPQAVATGQVVLWVKKFSTESYTEILKDNRIWTGYRNSIIYTCCNVVMSMTMTLLAAYALSKKYLRFRTAITFFFFLTMYIGGGMLPAYIQIKNMGLLNKPYTLIALCGFSVYNMIIARTFFTNTIDASLFEAAEIDGASEIQKFLRIAFPLSKPIIAVLSLYYAVSSWNSYFTGMLYLSNSSYFPLQVVIKNILIDGQTMLGGLDFGEMTEEQVKFYLHRLQLVESMKYSVIFIASLPMLIAYPFVQKHFVKGVMIGSVKG